MKRVFGAFIFLTVAAVPYTSFAKEVYCEPVDSSLASSYLVRSSDRVRLGLAMPTTDCSQAVQGANAGMVCTLNLSTRRWGYAPTSVSKKRATGNVGMKSIADCNEMIAPAKKFVICSYSGDSLGWKTTRTYGLPLEPARYPHRFGASNPSLSDCLFAANNSYVEWRQDRLIHQTCRWGGSEWFVTCAANPSVALAGYAKNVQDCVDLAQTPRPQCFRSIDRELKDLKESSQSVSRLPVDADAVVNKLRTYCAACHAIGKMNFLVSPSNEVVWKNLFSAKAPVSKKLWKDGIIEVLSWPSEEAPPFGELMNPPRDWMPKGNKRTQLAKDVLGEETVRKAIVSALEKGALKVPNGH